MSRPKLRSRDELEQELAVQISLGTVSSLEDAISSGLSPALEYGAQMLFDNVRKSVAEFEDLPDHIAQYLVEDRNAYIQATIYDIHYDKLTTEQKEDLFRKPCTQNNSNYYTYTQTRMRNAVGRIFSNAIENLDEDLILKCWNTGWLINHCPSFDNLKDLNSLRKLPRFITKLYESYSGNSLLNIFHPDSAVRKESIRKLFKDGASSINVPSIIKKCTSYYTTGRRGYRQGRLSTTKYMEEIQKLYITDPDINIRRELVQKTTNVNILNTLSVVETDDTLKLEAKTKASKLEKRNNYSRTYQQRKVNKLKV